MIHFNVCYEFDERVVVECIQFANEYPTDKYIKKRNSVFVCLLVFPKNYDPKVKGKLKKKKNVPRMNHPNQSYLLDDERNLPL